MVSGAHPRTTVLDLVGRRALPGRGGDRHAPLPQPRRLGEDQLHPVGAAPLRAGLGEEAAICCAPAWRCARRSTTWSAPGRTPCAASPLPAPYVEVEVPSARRLIADRRRHDGDDDVHPVRALREPRTGRRATARPTRSAASTSWPSTRRTCKDALIHHEVLAPPDLERIFGLVGWLDLPGRAGPRPDGVHAPLPLLAQYATPVGGLYLCGAGTHPGGGVMAACGHNAAQRVLKDRRGGAAAQVAYRLSIRPTPQRRAGIGLDARGATSAGRSGGLGARTPPVRPRRAMHAAAARAPPSACRTSTPRVRSAV